MNEGGCGGAPRKGLRAFEGPRPCALCPETEYRDMRYTVCFLVLKCWYKLTEP